MPSRTPSPIVDAANVALLRGVVTSDPVVRDLPSGTTVTNLEVMTRHEGVTSSVPVALHERCVGVVAGDEVVVVGHVRRRFFRAGGTTQSRTEVVAADVVPARRRATVLRLLQRVAGAVDPERA